MCNFRVAIVHFYVAFITIKNESNCAKLNINYYICCNPLKSPVTSAVLRNLEFSSKLSAFERIKV